MANGGRAQAPRALIWPASIKVMQRTFNPQNRARYPGGPPIRTRSAEFGTRNCCPASRLVCNCSTLCTLGSALQLPRGVTAAYRVLTTTNLVQVQARQPASIYDFGFTIY